MSISLKYRALSGAFWSAVERFSSQLVTFVVIIVMSRILTKSDYGLVGMLAIFIDVSQTIIDSGISQALIRKRDRCQKDCSTAFLVNIILALFLYMILFFASPAIARFYDHEELISLTRVISIGLLINALMMVQKAIFTARLDFKTQTKSSLAASVLSGVMGIVFAMQGMGVWSIVYYQLLKSGLTGIFLWYYSSWRPTLSFSKDSLRYFFRFGSNLTIAGVMHTIYRDMYLLVIGKFYQAASLGVYTRAYQFGQFPSDNIGNILQRVTYPVLCGIMDDQERLSKVFTKFLRMIAFIVFPLMLTLSVLSEPVIVFVVGEKWIEASPLLSVLSLSMMWIPLDLLNLNLLQVRGKTDFFLKCEIRKKIFGVMIIVATLPFGLLVMCWGQVMRAIIDMVIDTYYTGKYLGIGFCRQIKEIFPAISYSVVTAGAVWISTYRIEGAGFKVLTGMLTAVVVFLLLTALTRSADLEELKLLIRNRGK